MKILVLCDIDFFKPSLYYFQIHNKYGRYIDIAEFWAVISDKLVFFGAYKKLKKWWYFQPRLYHSEQIPEQNNKIAELQFRYLDIHFCCISKFFQNKMYNIVGILHSLRRKEITAYCVRIHRGGTAQSRACCPDRTDVLR